MYAVYILMIRTARKAVPISEHTLYNYIRKLREVLSKDKEISITTQKTAGINSMPSWFGSRSVRFILILWF